MKAQSLLACERERMDGLKIFQLPHSAKKVGVIIAVLAFALLFVNAFLMDKEIYRMVARYGLLIGLLIVSISKEAIEDERIKSLRMRSYAFAFVAGVAFSLVHPFVDAGVDLLIDPDSATVKEAGDFVILWLLLSIQVFSFHIFKR